MVIIKPLQHPAQPTAYFARSIMHAAAEFYFDLGKLAVHPLRNGHALELEPAFVTRHAAVVAVRPAFVGHWAGWVYAVDADTGAWKWRLKSNYPILSGMTPTAGGILFFGDMGGNFYALDSATGQRLWSVKTSGAIGGGVITYAVNGEQKVAVATGFTAILWPTEVVTGKIVILGLSDSANP